MIKILVALCMMVWVTFPAHAQQSQPGYFPALPPSRPCTREDITGLWRVTNVYESPAGLKTAIFSANPYQYLLLLDSNIYGDFKDSKPIGRQQMQRRIQNSKSLLQFVVQNGFIFFYANGKVTATQACFIVAGAQPPFAVGQMLLMPPEGQQPGRLVKAYTREAQQQQQKKRGGQKQRVKSKR